MPGAFDHLVSAKLWHSSSLVTQCRIYPKSRQLSDGASCKLDRNKSFNTRNLKALVSWIWSRSPALHGDVHYRVISIARRILQKIGSVTTSNLTRNAVRMSFAMEELCGLQKLTTESYIGRRYHDDINHTSRANYDFSRNVKLFPESDRHSVQTTLYSGPAGVPFTAGMAGSRL